MWKGVSHDVCQVICLAACRQFCTVQTFGFRAFFFVVGFSLMNLFHLSLLLLEW